MNSGRIAPINAGIADIRRWRDSDEVHLPLGQMQRVPFLPEQRPLDSILRRETLEERLAGFVIPDRISPDLGEPGAIQRARAALHDRFTALAAISPAATAAALHAAAAVLAEESVMDAEVNEALAALLRA